MPRALLIEKLTSAQVAPDEPLGTEPLYNGERNTKLYRMAKALRREGRTFDEVLVWVTDANNRCPAGPLPQEEILSLAKSGWKHAEVGPNPLQAAWQKVLAEKPCSLYRKFVSLARHVQRSQPGVPILLPVVLVGKLIGCNRFRVGRFRHRAVSEGVMEMVEEYVPRTKARSFRVFLPA
jgi:hypothetical protein